MGVFLRVALILVAAAAFAAETADPKVKLRESERDYYATLLQISQLQQRAVDLQSQIARQYADLEKACESGKMNHATFACEAK